MEEQVVYGKSFPIYILKKGEDIKIGSIALIDKIPIHPDKKNITPELHKHKIVFSMQQRYFRKLTPKMFEQIQNRILNIEF